MLSIYFYDNNGVKSGMQIHAYICMMRSNVKNISEATDLR